MFSHPELGRDLILGFIPDDWLHSLDYDTLERPDLRRSFAVWIRAASMRRDDYRIVFPEIDDSEAMSMGLSDRLQDWAMDYKTEGRQEGRQEGERVELQRLLTKRFGEVAPVYVDRISAASEPEIEAWLDRVFDATSIEAVFDSAA